MVVKKTKTAGKTIKRLSPAKISKPDYRTQIVIRFQDNIQLPYALDVQKYIKEYNVGPWDVFSKRHSGVTIEPLFSNVKKETLVGWIKKAKEMDPTYVEGNFFKYFKVICPVQVNPKEVLSDLQTWSNIKNAYIKTRNVNPAIAYTDEPLAVENIASPTDPYQRYLNSAPEGIGAKFVWDAAVPGSDGAGIKFIDIENGWTLDHEDLVSHAAACLYGTNEDVGREHGTSVLGVVCASDNTVGCVGIAPNLAKVDVVAQNPSGVASAILESLNHLSFGDILLIEATNTEDYGGVPSSVPVETTDPEFDAIRLATALGIVVIEPGGNGNGVDLPVNFDNFSNLTGEILNPGNAAQFRDSGAIIVSASQSAVSSVAGYTNMHNIMPWAPIGSRIDTYAWGENITTLSSDTLGATNQYRHDFGGTSGAAAIIAGVVASMQGMVFAEFGYKFNPLQLREMLRDSNYGTSLIRETGDPFDPVEVLNVFMPDLQKFTTNHLNYPPDLYLRDNIGDTGEPHAGAISASPDVILKNTAVADPVAAFGPGSGTENSVNLNDTAKINTINYIYFRVLNQGGMDATNVKVNIYYCAPATLLTPSLMNYIGEITIPNVPSGEILTVSDALEWTPTDVQGHYCFVALVSNDLDPVVDPKKLKDWDWNTYRRFIRENNNITWRNFNMEEVPAPVPPPPAPDPTPSPMPIPEPPKKDWKAIDFKAVGLPDKDQRMSLEIVSNLPKEAVLMLKSPMEWKREFFRGNPFINASKKLDVSYIPVKTKGNVLMKDIFFKKNQVIPLKLYINLHDKYFKKRCYTIYIRQILEGEEVGRVTWLLGSQKGFRI